MKMNEPKEPKEVKTYLCDDGNAEVKIEAFSAKGAAQEYVDDGSWGDVEESFTVAVCVQEIDEDGEEVGDREWITITVHPDEPSCTEGEHDWHSPHSIVGGCKSNPGVWGHGAGVICHEVCRHCNWQRITDTGATTEDGTQMTSISYETYDRLDTED